MRSIGRAAVLEITPPVVALSGTRMGSPVLTQRSTSGPSCNTDETTRAAASLDEMTGVMSYGS